MTGAYEEILISEITTGLYFTGNIWYSKTKMGISYPENGNKDYFEIEEQSFWFVHRNNILIEIINRYSNGNSFFDIGGGNGYVAKKLQENGFDAFLIEPGLEGIVNAQKRGVRKLINSTFQEACFKPNTLYNVGLFDVLEHIEDQDKILNDIYNVLTQDGMMFLTVPAFNLLWSDEDDYAGHFKRYRRNELVEIVRNHGFEVIYSTYFFSFLFFPVLFFRAIPSKIGLYKANLRKTKKHHLTKYVSHKNLEMLFNIELKKILTCNTLKIGSSILVVAKKNR